MTTEYEHGFADGRDAQAQELKRLQTQVAQLTAERDTLKAYYTRIEAAHAIYADEAREVGAPNMSLDDWLVYFMARDIDDIQKWNAIPWQALRSVFQAAAADGYYNDDVAEWLMENGVNL